MNNQTTKSNSHYNPIRIIVGNYKAGDKKFFTGNDKLLRKLLQNFDK